MTKLKINTRWLSPTSIKVTYNPKDTTLEAVMALFGHHLMVGHKCQENKAEAWVALTKESS